MKGNTFHQGGIVHSKQLLLGVGLGILGGLVGTLIMDVVMMLTFLMAGQPATAFFSMLRSGSSSADTKTTGIV